jgi:hypothetical protein
MIRFDAASITLLPWRRHAQAVPAQIRRHRTPSDAVATAPAADDDVPPRGCGWYVSSHDLACGLELLEGDWVDADPGGRLAAALRFD